MIGAGDGVDTTMPADLAAAAGLGGEMGRLFVEFDWAAHPLGCPAQWPAEVRAAVAVVLTSRFPIVLWLDADQLFLVYNDAYIQILGEKHPAALGRPGREVWWAIWEPISPMLASVIATGAATWSFDLMLPMMTAGRRRERYFTFTYSPLIGAGGEIRGIFCPSFETTDRVLSERRLQVLNAVASAVMDTHTIDDAVRAAVAACAGQADLPFVAAYVDADGSGESTEARAELPPGSVVLLYTDGLIERPTRLSTRGSPACWKRPAAARTCRSAISAPSYWTGWRRRAATPTMSWFWRCGPRTRARIASPPCCRPTWRSCRRRDNGYGTGWPPLEFAPDRRIFCLPPAKRSPTRSSTAAVATGGAPSPSRHFCVETPLPRRSAIPDAGRPTRRPACAATGVGEALP